MHNRIEKQRKIIDFTLSSLARRAGKNTALALVYTLLVFLLASVTFFAHALRTEASLVLRDGPDMVVQRMAAGRHELIPGGYGDRLRTITGVSKVRGRLWGYYYDDALGANYTLLVPERNAPAAGTVILGAGIARLRLAGPGDPLPFRRYDGTPVALTVGGLLSSASELVSSDLVLLAEQDFRRLFGMPAGRFTDFVLTVRNARELPTVAAKIRMLLPDTRPLMKSEMLRTYASLFDWRSGIVIVMLFSTVAAFVIFAWDKASGLSAEERREIGILKAVGWETSDVLMMKFWEGAVLSLLSFLAGLLLAYGHVFFTDAALFAPALKGWSVLYPEFRLTPFIDPYQVAVLFLLIVLPYTAATIIPAWRAATIDPDAVMRS